MSQTPAVKLFFFEREFNKSKNYFVGKIDD